MKSIPKYFSISLIVGLISLVIGLHFEFTYEIIFIGTILISVVTSGIAISAFWNKPIFRDAKSINGKLVDEGKNRSKETSSVLMISVSASLYAVLAGLSLVITTEFVFGSIIDKLESLEIDMFLISHETFHDIVFSNSNEILIAIAFLSTAIPFYHGAMVYISDKSRNIEIESNKGLVFHFSVLFIESILLIGIASSLASLTIVITLLILLQVVDSFWIILGQKTKNRPPLGWLGLNLGFSAVLIYSLHINSIPESLYFFVGFSIVRMIIDYVGFRNVYSYKTRVLNES